MFKALTIAVIAAAANAALIPNVSAQSYPTRSVALIIPFSAGGPTDTIGRIMADGASKVLGQPVVPENVTGASGSIGVGRVASAAPDGYTIGIGSWSTHVVDTAVNKRSYDGWADFAPIAMVAINPQVIVGKPGLPAKDARELVAYIKADPTKVFVGTTGDGTASHVSAVYLANIIGVKFQYVAYRGAANVVQDMLGGRIDLLFAQASQAIPLVRAGKLKGYAVTAKTRIPAMPEIPTVDEVGLTGLYITLWHAIWAPKGTPSAIVSALNNAMVKTLADPAVQQRLAGLGQEIPAAELQPPQGLRAYHKAEVDKWDPIIKSSRTKGN